ncbi:MAG: phospho-N-acetylmuramoyl-pentapeptide-transferase [Phycisphaerales bacterium]|jgi:phospho-N-acetylmuramoyl-pentapeptide-transferase
MLYLLISWLRDQLYDYWIDRVLAVFDQVQFRALLAAGLAFVMVVGLGPMTIRRLKALKMGDSGETDAEPLKTHAASKANVPTMGGILICAAIIVSTLLVADIRQFVVQLGLVVVVWLTVVGGADDYLKMTALRRGGGRQGLYAWEKLVFQLGIGLLAGFFLYNHGDSPGANDLQHVLNLPGQRTYQPGGHGIAPGLLYLGPGLFITISILMVAGMSNAVNITDGMDGLAGGISAIVALGLVILALVAGSETLSQTLLVPHVPFASELGVLGGAMGGACLGFLWWNCSPARVFMGDTGSLALGGLIGYLAVALRQEIVTLIMCAVFLLEIGSVVLQVGFFKWTRKRTGTGRRIFRVAPYHHHLHLGAWTESQVVVRLWIVAIFACILALATIKLR